MTIGLHTVTVTPVGGTAVDISCLCDQVAITHGRDDSDSQPAASSCTVDMSMNTHQAPMPVQLDVGATLEVSTALTSGSFKRFSGVITDINQGWDEAGEATPDMATAQVIAMGRLADLGRRIVGDVPWPQETDGARVARIMALLGIGTAADFDPGTVQILARDVDSQPALDVLQGVATDAGGLLWATRAGVIKYADAVHRKGATALLQLDACDVLVTPTWRRTTEGLVNQVSIGYGPTPQGGEQPRLVQSRADSQGHWGIWGMDAATQLAALADAQAMASLLLTRNHDPVWLMVALPVDVATLTLTETQQLLGLEVNDLFNLTGMPAAGQTPTQGAFWVEGWQETLAYGVHELQLAVSGYCRTSTAPTWDELPPTLTWDQVQGTWDDATCMPPTPSQGRWSDVPATLRWDQVAATITWDTWNG